MQILRVCTCILHPHVYFPLGSATLVFQIQIEPFMWGACVLTFSSDDYLAHTQYLLFLSLSIWQKKRA